jgi:ubiquinone/menaquinone biosynthesis C-methylase UbiE
VTSKKLSGNSGADYEQFMVPAIFAPWAGVLANYVKASPGERVLDVACGTGIVAREIVRRVGAKVKVVGCDSNAAMLATAREVAPEIDWREGNALDLPFDAGSFDVVTCQQAYQFFPDRVKAAQEAYRVLVDGGRIAVAVWCELSECPGQAAVASAVREILGSAAAEIAGSSSSFGDKAQLEQVFADAGFGRLKTTTETLGVRFASSDEITLGIVRGGALARSGVEVSEATMAQILRRVRSLLAGYQGATEAVYPMAANIVLASK